MISSHWRPEAGIVPSPASVARPLNVILSSTAQVRLAAGGGDVGLGAVSPGVIRMGALVSLSPVTGSVTRTRVSSAAATVYVRCVLTPVASPKTPSPFRSQEYDSVSP